MPPVRPALAALLLAAVPVAAQDGDKVYRKVVPSVVWVMSKRDRGLATGSGSLIDKDRRLVLTNYHVVEDQPRATVFFPVMRNGQPVPEREYYKDRGRELGIPGRVVAVDKRADLSIIQLERVPRDAPALPVAATGASPGQTVHSIGNAGASGGLWGYVRGTVRQVYRKRWQAQAGDRVLSFDARVVETDSPTNAGDSGGPLVNDAGELVGVTQGGAVKANLVSFFVDLSEVRRLLASDDVKAIPGGRSSARADDKKPEPAKRAKALTVSDKADLFPEDAEKKAQDLVDKLYADHKLDVLIETYPAVPEADREKVKGMTSTAQTEYVRDWARKRLAAEKVDGLVILIVDDPKKLYVDVSADQRKRFPDEAVKAVIRAVTEGLRKSPRDLTDALARIRDQVAEKK
jgi:hypothetical protein